MVQMLRCQHCNKDYQAQRGRVGYCSPACKQAAYRDRTKKKRNAQKAALRLQKSFALVFEQ